MQDDEVGHLAISSITPCSFKVDTANAKKIIASYNQVI